MTSSRRTPQQWQELIAQWQQSALPATQFCKHNNIGYASFCKWRKQLTVAPEAEAPRYNVAPAFIDLGTLQSPGRAWHIVLSLGNGVELKLSQG